MEITEEQRRRAEANRLAALEKRKRAAERFNDDAWKLFRCRKIPSPTLESSSISCLPAAPEQSKKPEPLPAPPVVEARFRVFIEICSPVEFSISPEPLRGFPFPGEAECFRIINDCLSSVVPVRSIESQSGQRASVYRLNDHDTVLRCLKKLSGVELQDIPHTTLSVVQKFQDCLGDRWNPFWKGYFSDEKVNELLERLPKLLRDALLPFQLEGVKFGLRRGGRCLIADEMGLGKTIQAIAIACCFLDEGPILVVCPAVLRFSWAEELEHWLPFLLPKDIHLVFGHQDSLNYLERHPKVVVTSYTMLKGLRKSMLEQKWAFLIVDESHNIRCTKKKLESAETEAIIDVAEKISRIVLLSGTPSLSRPYDIYHQINMLWPRLVGKDKYEFAKNYCLMNFAESQGKIYKDFSKGVRLEELNVLLRQTLMIRRLKEHVLAQLPPKRRQIIRLKLKKADLPLQACRVNEKICVDRENVTVSVTNCCSHLSDGRDVKSEDFNVCHEKDCQEKTLKELSNQEIGIAKLLGFCQWFSNQAIIRDSEDATSSALELGCQKMVIFAHHLKVLDGVQEFICEKGIQFVRIDGSTLPRDRQAAVGAFRQSKEVKVAIIGITAGGVGLDFTSAQHVVFLELPKTASEMLQAEDRTHRRGQKNAVNIYIFCAKDTLDESHWLSLNRSLFRVSSMMNGRVDAIQEIEVNRVFHLDHLDDVSNCSNPEGTATGELHDEKLATKCRTQVISMCSGMTQECLGSEAEHTKAYTHSSIKTKPLQVEVAKIEDRDMEEHSTLHENVTAEGMHGVTTNTVDGGAFERVEAEANCLSPAEALRFEVSKYTGRLHLYICIPGEDSRPRPLFVSFRPEDMESAVFLPDGIFKETTLEHWKENPAYCNIFQAFIKEWNGLRPIERNKLLGKPLQLPLSLELCYLKETMNHESGGLLRGGSKRRVTPLSDVSRPLPENAIWKKVVLHSNTAKEKEYTQGWTVSDEPLCKLCQETCKGKLAKGPEYFEDLFCNLSCFQEYRIRTNQGFLREALFRIEHGVCTQCKLDCHKLVKYIKPLSIARRKVYIEKIAPKLANQKKLFDNLVYEPSEGNAWHADHIIPVYKGGGECRLENMRTLCVACHSEITKAQQGERKLARQRARKQLRIAMKDLQNDNQRKAADSTVDRNGEKTEGEAAEDDLFVNVPGSAYSRSES